MRIQAYPSGPIDTNLYVVSCPKTNATALIDAPFGATEFCKEFCKNAKLKPELLLLTHTHWDHIGCAAELKELYGLQVAVHEIEAGHLRSPSSYGMNTPTELIGCEPDRLLKDGDTITLGEMTFEVWHTPGHSPGSCCFYNTQDSVLLSGDTLFKRAIGILTIPYANPDDMWVSLKRLEKLPPETAVYPGHGPKTTIGEEHWLPQARQIFG